MKRHWPPCQAWRYLGFGDVWLALGLLLGGSWAVVILLDTDWGYPAIPNGLFAVAFAAFTCLGLCLLCRALADRARISGSIRLAAWLDRLGDVAGTSCFLALFSSLTVLANLAAFFEDARPASEACLLGIICGPMGSLGVVGEYFDSLMLWSIAFVFDALGIVMLVACVKALWRGIRYHG